MELGMKQTQLVSELSDLLSQLDGLAHQTVAHRRKFQFSCTQFHKFLRSFSRHATDAELSSDQANAHRLISKICSEYRQLFSQYNIQCWAHFAIEVKCNVVATQLCTMAGKLRKITKCLNVEASQSFDPVSQLWLQYHILDLNAIEKSFAQHVSQNAKSEEPAALEKMQERLKSINNFLKQYEHEAGGRSSRDVSPIPVHYQNWRMNFSDLSLEKEVGSGVSANVFYGHDVKNGKEVAIKKLKFKKLMGSKLLTFQRELTILAQAQHPTILQFVGATDTPPFCIVTEWMPHGSLYHDLHKYHKLDATMRTIAMFDIARGMNFLHSRQIIHRDLKSLNILLDKDYHTRICDFGYSRHVSTDDIMTKNVGTPHWMAPELLDNSSGYDNKIDVYAYGIVCWELLTSQLPYYGLQATQVIAQVMVNDIRPPLPKNVSPPVKNLIEQCWARDPKARPTFNQILQRFRKLDLFFEGSDVKFVTDYINSAEIPELDSQMNEIESQLSTNPNELTIQAIIDLVQSLETEGAPVDTLEKCWDSLHKFENNNEHFAQCLVAFLGSPFIDKAAEELRKMPPGLIGNDTMNKILISIPSGNENIDTNLVIAACKNGFAAEAALHAVQTSNKKLALEIAAQNGVASEKTAESLVNHCLHILGDQDSMLNVAVLRVLVKLGKASLIPIETLKIDMQSKHNTLKLASFIAAAEMALEGSILPLDLIDFLSSKLLIEPLAPTVLIAACKDLETARHLISAFNYGSIPPPDIALKLLKQASMHHELAEELHSIVSSMLEKDIPEELVKQFEAILASTSS